MSAGYGVIASLGIGIGDHITRGAAERGGIRQTLAITFLTGIGLSLLASFVLAGTFLGRDLFLGAISGVLALLALGSLYMGYASATAGVVGPPAAVLAVVLPVAVDFAAGRVPTFTVVIGIAVGILSVLAISYAPHFAGDLRRGLLFSLCAGIGYGLLFVTLDYLRPESGFWPIVVQRSVAFLGITLICIIRRGPWSPGLPVIRTAVIGAVCAGIGTLSFTYGVQHGDLAPIAVTGTQYAAVTVVCGMLFRGERLWWWQVLGLVGSGTAVGLILAG